MHIRTVKDLIELIKQDPNLEKALTEESGEREIILRLPDNSAAYIGNIDIDSKRGTICIDVIQ